MARLLRIEQAATIALYAIMLPVAPFVIWGFPFPFAVQFGFACAWVAILTYNIVRTSSGAVYERETQQRGAPNSARGSAPVRYLQIAFALTGTLLVLAVGLFVVFMVTGVFAAVSSSFHLTVFGVIAALLTTVLVLNFVRTARRLL